MKSTPTGKALLLVQRVLSLRHFIQSSVPQNLGVAQKLTTLVMDGIFFLVGSLLRIQAVFIVARKNSTVDVGWNYTNSSSLGMICTNGFMNPTEKITNIATAIFLESIPMISSICDVLYTTFFFVSSFLRLIVNKLISYCLFLYTIASISL